MCSFGGHLLRWQWRCTWFAGVLAGYRLPTDGARRAAVHPPVDANSTPSSSEHALQRVTTGNIKVEGAQANEKRSHLVMQGVQKRWPHGSASGVRGMVCSLPFAAEPLLSPLSLSSSGELSAAAAFPELGPASLLPALLLLRLPLAADSVVKSSRQIGHDCSASIRLCEWFLFIHDIHIVHTLCTNDAYHTCHPAQ